MAAGVTPEILEAAPRVGGFIFVSFSIISFDKLPTFFLYSIIFGIFKPSSFLKSSMSALCLEGNLSKLIQFQFVPLCQI